MMFARVAAITLGALPLLAAATPLAVRGDTCSTGTLQCCNSLESSKSEAASLLLGLLGVVVEGVDVLLGINCSPLTVIGVGAGGSCDANAVCCQNNSVGGLISVGCVPVIL